ncbi:hypothetical protein CRM93_10270 [Acetobacter fabarum]|uniref:Uncharacterized protein n=2 Tax=Acetobacter fabarum TaxID=483199 RepID=A0A269XXQ5_9PROT|nr:hypothetical protein B8X00_07920 [Acetobacter fabarum]PEN24837.1 hypothetical protein CRM93_10270 [Acetobacter fabarum]
MHITTNVPVWLLWFGVYNMALCFLCCVVGGMRHAVQGGGLYTLTAWMQGVRAWREQVGDCSFLLIIIRIITYKRPT